jgi:hypothetical protein
MSQTADILAYHGSLREAYYMESYFSLLDEGKIQDAIASMKDKGAGLFKIIKGDMEAGLQQIAPDLLKHIQMAHPKNNLTLQAMKEAITMAVNKVNPMEVIKEIPHLVKKYGWKMGIAAAGWELFEHFCLPFILAHLGLPTSVAVASGILPIGELVFYPIAMKVMKGLGHA